MKAIVLLVALLMPLSSAAGTRYVYVTPEGKEIVSDSPAPENILKERGLTLKEMSFVPDAPAEKEKLPEGVLFVVPAGQPGMAETHGRDPVVTHRPAPAERVVIKEVVKERERPIIVNPVFIPPPPPPPPPPPMINVW